MGAGRVLVTGGAGFIGSHTVDLLLEKGYDVRVLDSLQSRVHPRGRPAYLAPEAEFLLGDVRDRGDLLQAMRGTEAVFHLAAYQDYMPDFSTFFAVNTLSTALVYELIVEHNLGVGKVVLASSQAVCGEGKYRCADHGVIYPPARSLEQLQRGDWELKCPRCEHNLEPLRIDECAVNPHTAYGISKYALEMAGLRLGRKYSIPTVALRYSIVQGPRNSFYNAYSGVCRVFTLRLLHGEAPVVYEDGKQLRDYVYVGDAVKANLLALESDDANYEVYNVGGQRGTSVLEFARIVAAACGKDIEPVVPGDFRLGDTRHTVSDSTKLAALGWRPTVPVEEIVKRYVQWVVEQPDAVEYYREAEAKMRAASVVRSAHAST